MNDRPHSKAGAAWPSAVDRRRSTRFKVFLRADYEVGSHRTFNFASNLSAGGLLLNGATRLEVGARLAIGLHLKTEPRPVMLRAVVRSVSRGARPSAGVAFLPDQEKAVAAVRRFIQEEIVAALEAGLARSLANTANVCLLAGHLVEVGRPHEAVALYERALEKTPTALPLYERYGSLLLAQARDEGADGPERLAELEALLARGRAVGESPVLLALHEEAAALRNGL